jgi:NAD(P)-dependent dehydrogenase (short-subunit alcohol dehydrogenase family)
MLLEKKRVIVTGGMTGIGRGTVIACAKNGATVISMSRKTPDHPDVKQLLGEAKALGKGSVSYMRCDVTDHDMVFRIFDEAVAKLGGLDGLIHSAAKSQESNVSLEECPPETTLDLFKTNVLGMFNTNQAALRHMKKAGSGSIVDFGSWAGIIGLLNDTVYGTMKGAVAAFVRNAALEWGKYGVRINNHCPATSETEQAEYFHSLMDPEEMEIYAEKLRARVPLKINTKWGTPTLEMVADTNVFLVSDLSSGITGQIISVDGGIMFTR